jgi:hypothetical protein
MVVDDVCGIGKTIGVTFRGAKENMFNVLSQVGKGKQEFYVAKYLCKFIVDNNLVDLPFNWFIVDNNLVDLPFHGPKFTWFKGDDISMSHLDRFLLSKE